MAQTTRLDRIYTADRDEICDIYNDWADTYDEDLIQAGYATPARVAEALARFEADRTQPVLDFACGTGLSGAALSAEGFTLIDGCDISEGMLERARARGVYRYLRLIGPEDAPAPEDALPATSWPAVQSHPGRHRPRRSTGFLHCSHRGDCWCCRSTITRWPTRPIWAASTTISTARACIC